MIGGFRQSYKLTIQSPITPTAKPIGFFSVSFSLKANTEPIHTDIIPGPLNNGKSKTEGTLPERLKKQHGQHADAAYEKLRGVVKIMVSVLLF